MATAYVRSLRPRLQKLLLKDRSWVCIKLGLGTIWIKRAWTQNRNSKLDKNGCEANLLYLPFQGRRHTLPPPHCRDRGSPPMTRDGDTPQFRSDVTHCELCNFNLSALFLLCISLVLFWWVCQTSLWSSKLGYAALNRDYRCNLYANRTYN